jgi:hypothetical protein
VRVQTEGLAQNICRSRIAHGEANNLDTVCSLYSVAVGSVQLYLLLRAFEFLIHELLLDYSRVAGFRAE